MLFYSKFRWYSLIVANVIELMVCWSLIPNAWNHNCDDALPSCDSLTTGWYWTILDQQIKYREPLRHGNFQWSNWVSGSLKIRSTHFIEHMEWVLSSSRRQIESGEIGACQVMICDIATGSVNCSSSAGCHIHNSGYAGSDAWNQHRDNSNNTLECSSNAKFQGNLYLIFVSLWVQ